MARGGGRGGQRTPRNPAPVSGPGALSRRTDGGPADVGVYASPAGERPYGERQKVEGLAQVAPTQGGGGAAAPAGPPPDPGAASAITNGVFGPTMRPDEPITAGVDVGAGPGRPTPVLPDDPNMVLRALVAAGYDHPDLIRLLTDG